MLVLSLLKCAFIYDKIGNGYTKLAVIIFFTERDKTMNKSDKKIKAVVFDMYETLITLYESEPYFGKNMSEDAGVPEEKFREVWNVLEEDRTIGKISLEEVVERILRNNNCYNDELKGKLVRKRFEAREESFRHLHKEIIPMLEGLKKRKVKIGLISNCYSEEAIVIKNSILYPYFDTALLSYDEGLKKPDEQIFRRCMERLNLSAEEILYVGDGGSFELETAGSLGMEVAQAVWYLKEGTKQPCQRKKGFVHLESPLEIFNMI